MKSWALVHQHPHHVVLLPVRLGQIIQQRLAQWTRVSLFSGWCGVWPAAGRQYFPQKIGGDSLLMVFHLVGMQFSAGARGTGGGIRMVPVRGALSLFSVLAFRTEPFFLGLAGELPGDYLLFNADLNERAAAPATQKA